MKDCVETKGLCNVCREAMTTIYTEFETGNKIYVCEKCLETAKENFIWICVGCGKVYIRPKSVVLKRLADPQTKEAFQTCEDVQIIQGIDRCIACDPEAIMSTVAAARSERIGGHC